MGPFSQLTKITQITDVCGRAQTENCRTVSTDTFLPTPNTFKNVNRTGKGGEPMSREGKFILWGNWEDLEVGLGQVQIVI